MLVSVVIPAYNEENRLPECLKHTTGYLRKQEFGSEIIVICDGCTDKTADAAESFKHEYPDIRVLELSRNRGKGFAVKTGMLSAKGDYRLFMDADYAVPIGFLSAFITLIDGNDLVIGSRGHEKTIVLNHQKYLRELAGKLFGRMQMIVLNIPYTDTQCGFKLFTRKAAEFIFPRITYECSYFDAELMYIARRAGMRVVEAPVTWNHDGVTRMPIGVSRTADLISKMFRLRSIHNDTERFVQ